ncbi:PH domain-containing protein [Mycena sanguinolenta]|uniref:PH domain-containing protein n=1 Tax=Mycena sanguinolenta TaxID=230812 RepID=A0A8H6XIC5_9AGAR|nr:PH domain-containing protein [Mycena sanguinolenta]
MGKKKTFFEEKELRALGVPFPDELDRCFRHPSDPADDFASAYIRAVDFAAELGDTLAAHLWQQALEIGLQAGRGNVNAVASDAREEGMRQGRELGRSDGLKEGLSEGKRVGFVAGREFGEKRAAKLSTSVGVLFATGTDSPPLDSSVVPPARSLVHAATQTDRAVDTIIPTAVAIVPAAITPSITRAPARSWVDHRVYVPDQPPPSPSAPSPSATLHAPVQANATPVPIVPSISPSPPFSWADDPSPDLSRILPLPPRDFSALRSEASTSTPFSTLRYRAHRRHRSTRAPHFHVSRSSLHSQPATSNPPFRSSASKVAFTTTSTLDWDRDPRLSDLSRVLRSMGWRREGGGVW